MNQSNNNGRFAQDELQKEAIDLRHYLQVLKGQKWNILGLSSVITLLAVLIVLSMESIYLGSTTLLIESDKNKVLSIDDVYGPNTARKEYFLTQFEILKSRALAERVVHRLELTKHKEFDPRQKEKGFSLASLSPIDQGEKTLTEADIFQGVVKILRKKISIAPVRSTQIVAIHYESRDAQLAADITNAMADVFIESHLESKLNATQKAANWLGERLGGLRSTLQVSEQKLQQFRETEELIDVEGVRTLGAQELDELTRQFAEARNLRAQLASIQSQIGQIGTNANVERYMELPSVLKHPIIQSIKEIELAANLKASELSKRYGPKHPKMIAARSEADSATRDLRSQVQRVIRGMSSDYRAAQQNEQAIVQQLAEAKKRFQVVNRKEFRLRELEREVQTNRQLYDMFMTRAKETDEASGLQSAHARVIDSAVPARDPIKPKKALIVLLAALASIALGVVLAFLQDILNNTVRTPGDVEEKLKASFLGFLPLIKDNKSDLAFEGFIADPKSSFSEAIRTIRTGLMLSNLDEPHKITVITSSLPNEGKSTVSINLAEAVGQMEKVLLIDADMRRPTLAKTLKLPRNAPGLSNIVAGTADFKDCVHTLENSTVEVITSGVVPLNPLELLSSKRFGKVLEALQQRYDRIILDSAPTHAVSDAMVLSTYADALVYVVKADVTAAPLAAKGIKSLREIGAPITGVVLNQVDLDKAGKSGGYYDGYYSYYGYASEED